MAFLSSTKKNTSNSSYYSLLIPFVIFVAFALSIYLAFQSEVKSTFPKFATDAFTFTAWINAGEDYLKDHYKWITRLIASYVKVGYYGFEDFLLDSSWVFVAALMIVPSFMIAD